MRFHHIGYAVSSIADYLDGFFRDAFDPVQVSEPVADPIQRVRVCFAQMHPSSAGPYGALIELVEPLDQDSPINNIVGSQRGGLYHLCYEVDDLDAQLKRLRRMRCMPLARPAPAAAFGGRRIVFVLTPQHDLIELLEAPSPEVLADRPTRANDH
jgi:methylmalonyl-CoA/ethylmalonyl-CoA epimerase